MQVYVVLVGYYRNIDSIYAEYDMAVKRVNELGGDAQFEIWGGKRRRGIKRPSKYYLYIRSKI